MNTPVSLYPLRSERGARPAEWHSALSGRLLAVRTEALFASSLSAQREYTPVEIAAAISDAIGTHSSIRGCAAEVAAAYGEHPETATRRMRWARAVIEGINASAGSPGASS
jgi:hypothetical protein